MYLVYDTLFHFFDFVVMLANVIFSYKFASLRYYSYTSALHGIYLLVFHCVQ